METSTVLETVFIFISGTGFGGLALYLYMKEKLQKLHNQTAFRRINMLEQVAQHAGKVSHVFSRYASLVTEIGISRDRMSPGQKKELDELSTQLVDVYEEVAIAESKLLLLGEQKLEKALKLYTTKMAQFRKQIYPGRFNSIEEASRLKKEVSEMREQFYNVLSQRYDQRIG
tara:strand:+ start:834 stop:1349 length:516 start_codon:yes stop_codon:yes gene_type:complete